jgi:hypothetical protein
VPGFRDVHDIDSPGSLHAGYGSLLQGIGLHTVKQKYWTVNLGPRIPLHQAGLCLTMVVEHDADIMSIDSGHFGFGPFRLTIGIKNTHIVTYRTFVNLACTHLF